MGIWEHRPSQSAVFLDSILRVIVFWEFIHFIYIIKHIGTKLFIYPFYLFNVCTTVVIYFSFLNICYQFILSFILHQLLQKFYFLISFKEPTFGLFDLSIACLISSSLASVYIFIILSLLLYLGLICCSLLIF